MSIDLLNSLVNANLSDIEDLPDFARLPIGVYKLRGQKAEIGETSKKEGVIKLTFALIEPVEVPEEGKADLPANGSLCSFQYSGEFGVKKFKKIFLDVLQATNCSNIAQFLDQFDGLEFVAAIKHRVVAHDAQPSKTYAEIQTLALG